MSVRLIDNLAAFRIWATAGGDGHATWEIERYRAALLFAAYDAALARVEVATLTPEEAQALRALTDTDLANIGLSASKRRMFVAKVRRIAGDTGEAT